jgi:ATP-binding cassette, subfamily B, bacterial PglK
MRTEIRKTVDLIAPQEYRRLAVTLLAMLVAAILQVIGVASIMPFITLVANPEIVQQNPWMSWAYERSGVQSTRQFLVVIGFLVLLLLAATNAFTAFSRWLTLHFVWATHHRLAVRLLEKYLHQPYSFFLQRNTAKLSKSLLAEVKEAMQGVFIPMMEVTARVLTALLLVLLLFIVDPLLSALVACILGSAYGSVYIAIRKKQKSLGVQRLAANGSRFQAASEAFGGIKDVKILEREQHFLARFRAPSIHYSQTNATNAVMRELPRFALETIAFGGVIATLIYLLETRDSLDQVLPVIALFAMAAYRLMPALQAIFAGLTSIRFHSPALAALHKDLYRTQRGPASVLPLSQGSRECQADTLPFRREIRFENVGFHYPKSAKAAIQDISLLIPRNHTIGLIGTTGSGKTTLVDLLLGLFEPSSGQILIDDVPLTVENVSAWKRNLGYVPQSIFLTDNTIADNIAFGVSEELIDRPALERAARAAHIHTFIKDLPLGYDTVVGERGVRLSGGERQRIGIARALYRNPDILIMDEATSALDGITEDAVMQAIRSLSGHKTIILIAHRLTTVQNCDTIYMLENGSVVAEGTFASLAASNLTFRAMANEAQSGSTTCARPGQDAALVEPPIRRAVALP